MSERSEDRLLGRRRRRLGRFTRNSGGAVARSARQAQAPRPGRDSLRSSRPGPGVGVAARIRTALPASARAPRAARRCRPELRPAPTLRLGQPGEGVLPAHRCEVGAPGERDESDPALLGAHAVRLRRALDRRNLGFEPRERLEPPGRARRVVERRLFRAIDASTAARAANRRFPVAIDSASQATPGRRLKPERGDAGWPWSRPTRASATSSASSSGMVPAARWPESRDSSSARRRRAAERPRPMSRMDSCQSRRRDPNSWPRVCSASDSRYRPTSPST